MTDAEQAHGLSAWSDHGSGLWCCIIPLTRREMAQLPLTRALIKRMISVNPLIPWVKNSKCINGSQAASIGHDPSIRGMQSLPLGDADCMSLINES